MAVETTAINMVVDSGTISGAESYSFKEVKTDENGKLYLWLPIGATVISITIDGVVYSITM